MKKIITLFTFVFASMVFANASFAQNTSEKEIMKDTREQVSQLGTQLDLNAKQKDLMARYLFAYNLNFDRNLAGTEKNEMFEKKNQKYASELMSSAKKTLNPEQFKKFQKLVAQGEALHKKE